MSHKIGVHWIKTHGRPEDLNYIRALVPPSVKLIAGDVPDVQWVSDTYQAAPNTLIVLRSWAMSEQKADMASNPTATGKRHANEWRAHIDRLRGQAGQRGLPFPPDANLLVLGINEPEVWKHLGQTVEYTVAFLETCKGHGLKAGALNLSVGWPANTGPNTPPDWAPYAPVLGAIERGGHYLVLHEYWADQGIDEMWGWWAGRYAKCPWNVPIIIGECGLEMKVKDPNVPDGRRGWMNRVTPGRYLEQIKDYHEAVLRDPRIHSIQIFSTDYGHPWSDFDTLPIHSALASYAQVVRPVPSLERPAYVTAPDGLNMRAQPTTTGKITTAIPFGQKVAITGAKVGEWWPARYGNQSGYLFAYYVSEQPPVIVGNPPGATDNFARALAWLLKEEGGYTTGLKDDPGGETNRGISKRSYPHLDIKNLTMQQTTDIYFKDYWTASGAYQMPWPMCLVQFDSAVQHGPGVARQLYAGATGSAMRYLGLRLEYYADAHNIDTHEKPWGNRMGRLLLEVSK